MAHAHDPNRTRLDPYPAADPTMRQDPATSRIPEPRPVSAPREPHPPPMGPRGAYEEEILEEGVADRDYRRMRTANIACTVIHVITGMFALVLAVHILLVLGKANMANGFAAFVDGWASGITLGLTGLFTPGDPMIATLLNEGLAALLWLVIGGVLTYVIRRIAMPGPRRTQHYRYLVR
jgi:hypothetical protein